MPQSKGLLRHQQCGQRAASLARLPPVSSFSKMFVAKCLEKHRSLNYTIATTKMNIVSGSDHCELDLEARMVQTASAELPSQEWYQPAVLIQVATFERLTWHFQEGLLGVEGSNRICRMASIDFPDQATSDEYKASLEGFGDTTWPGWACRHRLRHVENGGGHQRGVSLCYF